MNIALPGTPPRMPPGRVNTLLRPAPQKHDTKAQNSPLPFTVWSWGSKGSKYESLEPQNKELGLRIIWLRE